MEKVRGKTTFFKWHYSFFLQVGYGTLRKDSTFQGLNPVIRRKSGIMEKWKNMPFTESLEVGS
jgi:hypothetical protein